MRTVLVLTNNMSGLHSFRKEVIQAIRDAGYEVVISAPLADMDEPKSEYFRNIGCTVLDTAFNRKGTNPISDIKLMFTYVGYMHKFDPIAVLTYTIKPNVYGGMAAVLTGKKLLANITGLGSTMENSGIMRKLNIFLYRIGLSMACKVFFQNQENLIFFKKNKILRTEAILLPGSGVNLDFHKPVGYPADNGFTRFIFVGRLLEDKGVGELFSAITKLKLQFGNAVTLEIVGPAEDNYSGQLEQLQKDGIVLWHGAQQDVRPFVAACNCLVLPSYHEGMSNVLQEACAAARPVITTNVSGCKEIVNDGETGLLCNVKDAKDLEAKMQQFHLMSYEAKRAMGLAARKKVENEFNRKIVVDKYLEEIDKLLEK